MKSLRFDRRIAYMLTAFTFLVAAISPGLVTATVHADVLQNRSITMSSASAGVTANTNYKVEFNVGSGGAAGALLIEFCSNSPLIGTSCTAPTGMVATTVNTPDGSTTVSSSAANRIKVLKTISASSTVTVNLGQIKNPSSIGTFYARMLTYTDDTALGSNTSASPGTYIDDGGVALSITDTIGVSAAVLESMTFCVSGNATTPIGESCDPTDIDPATLTLGEDTGGVKALSSTAVSTGLVRTQISTNASGGAVIRMKSSATNCGGLIRTGSSACGIGPATSGISNGDALFGVKLGTAYATSGASNPTGTLQAYPSSGYNTSTYLMNYTSGNTAGVTGPYGDDFLDTNDAPINNQNIDLTFGASVSPNTPAGLYAADISLIAAGKF